MPKNDTTPRAQATRTLAELVARRKAALNDAKGAISHVDHARDQREAAARARSKSKPALRK
ncbi:MAG: hypothetical protein ABI376_01530 [Caulobacteraceae bacterium]